MLQNSIINKYYSLFTCFFLSLCCFFVLESIKCMIWAIFCFFLLSVCVCVWFSNSVCMHVQDSLGGCIYACVLVWDSLCFGRTGLLINVLLCHRFMVILVRTYIYIPCFCAIKMYSALTHQRWKCSINPQVLLSILMECVNSCWFVWEGGPTAV